MLKRLEKVLAGLNENSDQINYVNTYNRIILTYFTLIVMVVQDIYAYTQKEMNFPNSIATR